MKIPSSIFKFLNPENEIHEICTYTANTYKTIKSESPLISIVIPAFNEGENIVATLSSLCANKTNKGIEIIVVNNNSKDNTEALVKACGVQCILETKQGISYARNKGLFMAKGKYILNADADTIYPENWIDEMVKPLIDDNKVAIVYGKFSFIPVGQTGRAIYFIYEHFADLARWINKYLKDEAVNVYGFTSAVRKDQALSVNGFDHPNGANEDGYMALKLRDKGYGKFYNVTTNKALVWTTDRRMQIDGGLIKAIWRRINRVFFNGER